ncbi:GAF domain-containing protein [Streptomyces sp. M10(2022)]
MRYIGTGLELSATLERICETAADLAGARYAAIGVVDESGGDSPTSSSTGSRRRPPVRSGAVPTGAGAPGHADPRSGPIRLKDLTADPRSAGFPPGHPSMRTFLGVPVRVQERSSATSIWRRSTGAEFDDYDLHMLRVLATEAGIAIGNARLYEAARQRERWIDGSVAVTTALLRRGRR